MVAAQKAAWAAFLVVVLAPSTRALRLRDGESEAQYESIKLGYCAGNRVGLGQDTAHGIDNPSLDECAKYVLSDERCVPGGYFDAVVLNNGLYQCKCPTGTHDCVVASQPLSGDWNIYRATAATAATGDPHLQNIHGERFDLMRPGETMLIQIPRGVPVKDSMLTVEADAVRLGESCADLYFQTVNITGTWASSDIHFNAEMSPDKKATWLQFGPVEVKVAHGHTEKGQKYLNIFVKHLGRANTAVGGLLGEGDHTEASTPSAECRMIMSLHATRSASKFEYASVAIAAL
jgi:hypothetical protein